MLTNILPIVIAGVSGDWKRKDNILFKTKEVFIKLSGFTWRGSVTCKGIGSFHTWKWKFIKVHLMNLEGKLKVYYIKIDPYEKTSTQRLK